MITTGLTHGGECAKKNNLSLSHTLSHSVLSLHLLAFPGQLSSWRRRNVTGTWRGARAMSVQSGAPDRGWWRARREPPRDPEVPELSSPNQNQRRRGVGWRGLSTPKPTEGGTGVRTGGLRASSLIKATRRNIKNKKKKMESKYDRFWTSAREPLSALTAFS